MLVAANPRTAIGSLKVALVLTNITIAIFLGGSLIVMLRFSMHNSGSSLIVPSIFFIVFGRETKMLPRLVM